MIGERIVRFRLNYGMSVQDLAEQTSIPLKYLYDIEQGRWLYPSVQYIEKIAGTLNVEVHDILGPKTEYEAAADLDDKWMNVVEEAMSSNVSKDQFREFLESKKRGSQAKEERIDFS